MPTTFDRVESGPLLDKLIDRSFPDLAEAKVTFCILMAANPDGPAIKHGGSPAAAKIKVTSLKDRVAGLEDVVIVIDAAVWGHKTDRQQEALLAHELTHLVVKRDKDDGRVLTDDSGRPKLGAKPDDWFLNGFFDVAKKYGDDAHEVQVLKQLKQEFVQRSLFDDWG